MAIFEDRGYNIDEIISKDYLRVSRHTFNKHIRKEKNFPDPYFESGNSVLFWGTRIQYWLDKKSGR